MDRNPNPVPPILKDLTHTQAQVVLAAYHEDGVHASSVDTFTRGRLVSNRYLYLDEEWFLNVTSHICEKLDLFYKLS